MWWETYEDEYAGSADVVGLCEGWLEDVGCAVGAAIVADSVVPDNHPIVAGRFDFELHLLDVVTHVGSGGKTVGIGLVFDEAEPGATLKAYNRIVRGEHWSDIEWSLLTGDYPYPHPSDDETEIERLAAAAHLLARCSQAHKVASERVELDITNGDVDGVVAITITWDPRFDADGTADTQAQGHLMDGFLRLTLKEQIESQGDMYGVTDDGTVLKVDVSATDAHLIACSVHWAECTGAATGVDGVSVQALLMAKFGFGRLV